MELLYTVDKAIFLFINQTLSNPVGDTLWPLITDYDKLAVARILLVSAWLLLVVRGGRRGREAALMIIPVILCADTLNSSIIKGLVGRPRPCHEMNGTAVIQGIHLLVDCGPGKSFPSSHAVNNFAAATVFSFYYRKFAWAFAGWAAIVALSRTAVGVHYPSDIIAGGILGIALAAFWIWVWLKIQKTFFPQEIVVGPERNTA